MLFSLSGLKIRNSKKLAISGLFILTLICLSVIVLAVNITNISLDGSDISSNNMTQINVSQGYSFNFIINTENQNVSEIFVNTTGSVENISSIFIGSENTNWTSLFENTTNLLNWTNTSNQLNGTAWFGFNFQVPTHLSGEFNFTIYANNGTMSLVNTTQFIARGFTPINITLLSPQNGTIMNVSTFNLTYNVNIQANCTIQVWNGSGAEIDTGNSTGSGLMKFIINEMDNGNYSWNVYCVDAGNSSNEALGNESNWTFTVNASEEQIPVNVTLLAPEDNSTINISYFSLNFTVNIYTNCTKTVWNSSGYEVDSGTAGANGLTGYGLDLSNGNYSWNVFCWDIGNESNNDTGALENWTFIVNASGEEVSVNVNKQDTTPPPYEINSTIQFIITITNDGFENLTEINLTDIYNASYITYTWASVQPNEIYPGQINWISIDNGTPLESGDNITIYVNFTAIDECMETSNVAIVNATNGTVYVSDNWGFDFNIHGEGPGPGPEDDWEKGLNEWQSNIVSPYLIKDQWKLINFSIYREAGEQSCLDNLTIILPNSNFTFNGYNNSTSDNYTFSVEGDELIWQSNQSNSTFFCGRGPENFVVNISSNDSYGSDLFQVISGSENMIDDMNLTIFTTTTFSYNGTIYDINGNPLSGAVASIVASSFGQQGDTILGNFLANTLENGIFNITNVPGLNASLDEGPGGPGGPGGEGSIFYRLTATKYNDSENHYAMYVGPSLPDLPESELRSDSGLNNPEIYLKPAITFHIHVGGHDYRSEPNNTNETCPGPQCPGWEPEFNWTNIGFSYGLKDKKMGFPVSSEFSSNTIERYFSAPRDRNYSLMIFPEASFPIYVDFESINSTCNSTGYDLSTTGVNATCTIKNGTHVIDAIISSAMNLTPLTGKVDIMNLTDLWIIPYRLGAGNMIFDQDILPFNLRQMDRWPKNDTQYDDFYNKSSGEYSVYLPATEAHSDIMLMAFAEKNNTYYLDYFKLSSEGQNFSVSEYNFTLNKLIGGVSKTISSNNISADWNSTVVVNTTAVRFNLINNGCVLRDENAFVDIKMELDGDEYMRMTNSQNGAFTIPLIEGEGIKKLTIYSQSYAPVSAPVSANVLNGSSNTSTIKCKDGECNITLSRFDPFDPDDPNATLSITMDFYKSNSTCDVPNPLEGCNMVGDMNDTKFSPLKAILMGDISLRITSGNISVHYVKTDLLASGPPDAAFSQNSTGSDMEAAWKFGSKGPEIYDEVLISMPYADSLSDKIITVNITLLYDNEFNTIWNASAGDTIENIQNNENLEDYRDYLNNSYEAYLNGTGVVCSETDENLSTGLCYKDMISKVIWIKIPHFSGVGPQVTGTGTIAGEVNFTATKTALNSVYGIGDFVEYIINITNNDDQNITLVNVNDTFNSGYLAFNSSNVTESSTGLGWVCWFNVTNGAVVQPNNTFSFAVNMTAFTLGNNITNSIFVNATQTDGGNSAANASVDINIDDIIPPIWLNNKTNSSTAKTQQSIQFNVTLNDNAAGGYNIFSFNNGTHWTNNTAETWISGTEISEAKTITATRGQIINWYWWFNDSLGNENQTDIWNFTVVNTQPTQPILTYTNNSNTSIQPILRWINATDPDNDPLTHTIYISNNSDFTQINQSSTGNQQYQTIGLTDGIWYWKVNASDNYANTLSEIRQFTLDATSPQIDFINPITETGSHSQNYLEANVTSSDPGAGLDEVTIYLYNSTDLLYKYTSSTGFFHNFTGLFDGTYYLNATANDTFGNINRTETRIITLDTTNPLISGVNINNQSLNLTEIVEITNADGNLTINWTVTEINLSITNLSIDSGIIVNETSENINSFFAVVDAGFHILKFSAVDYAGNAINYNYNIKINAMENLTEKMESIESDSNILDAVLKTDNGTNLTGLEYLNKTLSLELELNVSGTGATITIPNFTGLDANWNQTDFSSVVNISSTQATNAGLNAGANFTIFVLLINATSFLNSTNFENGASIFINQNVAGLDVFYIADDIGDEIYKLGYCPNGLRPNQINLTTMCYLNTSTNVTLYTPHLSGGGLGNDTVSPTLNITTPVNKSLVTNSYFNFNFTAKEANPKQDFCWFNLTNGTDTIKNGTITNDSLTWIGTSGIYADIFREIGNGYYNLTINCTDLNNQSTQLHHNFTVNDTLQPEITNISTATSGTGTSTVTITLSVTTDEYAVCRYTTISNETNYSSMGTFDSSGTTIHSRVFTYNSDSSGTYYVRCNDTAGNVMNISNNTNYIADVAANDERGNNNGGSTGGGTYTPPKKEKLKNATKKLDLIPGVGLRNNTKLQAAIEKVLAKGKMSEQARQNMLRLSESITSNFEATREFKIEQNKSRLSMKLKYKGNETVNNFMIYEKIPKTFANSTDLITVTALGATIEIVEEDPEYLFTYSELSEGNEIVITYEVFGEKDVGLINDTSVEFYAEGLGESIIEVEDEEREIPEKICDEGDKICLGNILQECKDNKWMAVQTCEYGCNPTSLICNSSKPGESNYLIDLFILLIVGLGMLVYLKKDKIIDLANHIKTEKI